VLLRAYRIKRLSLSPGLGIRLDQPADLISWYSAFLGLSVCPWSRAKMGVTGLALLWLVAVPMAVAADSNDGNFFCDVLQPAAEAGNVRYSCRTGNCF
jgi:hypothetical protein